MSMTSRINMFLKNASSVQKLDWRKRGFVSEVYIMKWIKIFISTIVVQNDYDNTHFFNSLLYYVMHYA